MCVPSLSDPKDGRALCLSHSQVLLLVSLGLSLLHLATSIALDYSCSILRNGLLPSQVSCPVTGTEQESHLYDQLVLRH